MEYFAEHAVNNVTDSSLRKWAVSIIEYPILSSSKFNEMNYNEKNIYRKAEPVNNSYRSYCMYASFRIKLND